jgi:catechol 2,3-dioxygenase-like lactoylglutathione lyase family enzyme
MDTHPVPWAGRHHLALVTDTLERTTRVWHGVMGAPLVATLGTETFRPSGVDAGHGATVAFVESRPPGRSLRQPCRDTGCAGCAV